MRTLIFTVLLAVGFITLGGCGYRHYRGHHRSSVHVGYYEHRSHHGHHSYHGRGHHGSHRGHHRAPQCHY